MNAATRTAATSPWSIDPAAVREAVLSILPDPEALDFTCVAILGGVSSREAGLIGDVLFEQQRQSQGCIPRGCFR